MTETLIMLAALAAIGAIAISVLPTASSAAIGTLAGAMIIFLIYRFTQE